VWDRQLNNTESSNKANKENKRKKDDNEDFIVRVGGIPMQNIPLNVCIFLCSKTKRKISTCLH